MSIPRTITGISKPDSALSHVSQPPVTLSIPADVPIASPSALNFIEKITATDLKFTYFSDDLMTFTDLQTEMGFYKATVKEGCYKGDDCILVEARSEGKVEGVPCCTEVTAFIDSGLQTLYQELHEMVQLPHGALERYTLIELVPEGYRVHKEVRQGGASDQHDVMERVFERVVMTGYISEGANVVLQRILVAKGLPDHFDVLSFDSDTNLCLASYSDLALTDILVGPDQLPVRCCGLERRLRCVTDVPVTWHTYLLPQDGHLVSRCQVGSPIVMKVRVVPVPLEHEEFLPVPTFPRAQLQWRDDLQLTSMFRQRKEEITSAHRLYLRTHPELQALVADFLQALLAHKPADTVQFAQQFFATFSNRSIVAAMAAASSDGANREHSARPGLLLSDYQ